jgi:hypothetical protein
VRAAQNLRDVFRLRANAAAGEDLDLALGKFRIRYWIAEGLEDLDGQHARYTQPAGHAAAGGKQHASEAPGPAQGEDWRRRSIPSPEQLREVQDPARLGAAKCVDRLVGIPHDDDIPAVTGDHLQQPHLGGIGVLILVDQDTTNLATQCCRDLGSSQQNAAAVHQLGVIQHTFRIQHVEVLVEEGSDAHPLLSAGGVSCCDDVIRIHAQLSCLGQHRTNLARKRPGWKRTGERVRPLGALSF